MTCGDFIGNLEGLNDGGDFPRELLKVVRGGHSASRYCWKGRTGYLSSSRVVRRGGLGLGICWVAPAAGTWALVTQLGDRPLAQPPQAGSHRTCARACNPEAGERGAGSGKHVSWPSWTPHFALFGSSFLVFTEGGREMSPLVRGGGVCTGTLLSTLT